MAVRWMLGNSGTAAQHPATSDGRVAQQRLS